MLLGVSGWRQMDQGGWWMGGRVTRQVDRDRLRAGQRAGEVFGVFVSFLVLLFFIENQVRGTGLFTSRFGLSDQALFYGTWVVGMLASLTRAAYGRRNAARPIDVLAGALLAVTSFWFLSAFPFDFSHFPDLLPASVRFAFWWVSNPVGKVALVLGGIGGLASMLYNAVMYAVVRSRQRYGGTSRSW